MALNGGMKSVLLKMEENL